MIINRFGSTLALYELTVAARFLTGLPGFLRCPITVAEALATLRWRLEGRETDFLRLTRRAIYAYPASPYRQLLQLVGCEYGDLERLVRQEGVEGALRVLCRQGVYLTVEEFKGRQPAVRGSATVTANPGKLRNPCSTPQVATETSGSRGAPTSVLTNLAFIRDCAVDTCLDLDAKGGNGWLKAVWQTPGAGVFRVLKYSSFGAPTVRWFSQVDPAAPGLHRAYRWRIRVLRWGGLLAGVPLPQPEYVPLDDPLPIALWMARELRAGQTPHLRGLASSVVRLCHAARAAGIDLRGARFTLAGEPVTAARLESVRQVGAEAWPRYGSMDTGPVGFGCLAPQAPDDVHLLHDLHGLVQPDAAGIDSALPRLTLLLSSIRLTAPLIMLNVSLGDEAEMVRQACGCPLERLGWTTHLHKVRSFEKLTAAGMTFLDTDVIRVLEEVLPGRFGGGPTDYQLVEEETDDGRPRLRLLVHPAVGPLDSTAVADAFLTAISRGEDSHRLMGLVWRDAKLLRVERLAPRTASSGKILHLHKERPRADSPVYGPPA